VTNYRPNFHLTNFNIWRGGPSGRQTNRPTWQVPGCQVVQSALGSTVRAARAGLIFAALYDRLLVFYRLIPYGRSFRFFVPHLRDIKEIRKVFAWFHYSSVIVEYTLRCWFHFKNKRCFTSTCTSTRAHIFFYDSKLYMYAYLKGRPTESAARGDRPFSSLSPLLAQIHLELHILCRTAH